MSKEKKKTPARVNIITVKTNSDEDEREGYLTPKNNNYHVRKCAEKV